MIFCIIGKTGVGKTTIAKAVSTTLNIPIIVTYTNRPKRPNEKNGVDYHFVDDKYFDDNIDDFIDLRCYKVATGEIWKYGISKKQINKRDNYIVVIDTVGYENLSKHFDTKAIIIDSYDNIIIDRLIQRGDSLEEVERRLEDDKNKIEKFLEKTPIEKRIMIFNNDNIYSAKVDCIQSISVAICDKTYKKIRHYLELTIITSIISLLCLLYHIFLK